MGASMCYCMFHAREDEDAFIKTHAGILAGAFIDQIEKITGDSETMNINRGQTYPKGFSGKPVLEDISFETSGGSILCLLGPSGAGKTTLIRLILGAIPADNGSITAGGLARCPTSSVLRDDRLHAAKRRAV